MSRKIPVPKLQEITLDLLADIIATTVNNEIQSTYGLNLELDMALVIIEIKSYLEDSGTVSVIYEDLLKVILDSNTLEASVRLVCLQILLNQSVHNLVTHEFPYSYYEKVLQVIAAQGHGLRLLDLRGKFSY